MQDESRPSPPLLVTKSFLIMKERTSSLRATRGSAHPPEHQLPSLWPDLSPRAGYESARRAPRGAPEGLRRQERWSQRLLAEISSKLCTRTPASAAGPAGMSAHHRTLLCVGMLLMSAGGVLAFIVGPLQMVPFLIGILLGVVGAALFITGLCLAMKNLQVAVPGHFLLHPRTGTRFNPQQAQAIQRRLDRIRREMSSDSVEEAPEPEPPLPCTPPPWTMEPPPSYDTVMKSQQL
ncbi:hypothetical protein OJAV_G00036060 [Oryzias javanicus]|uniref:Uncharacterized protein n=1 Tax=Oryzias javanicus TaxID=123683 RepID=A0A3S2MED0_ORYJA|nr:hypothetical protein OJAV_G00036060 [Oryzias javanicus]